MSRLAEPRTAPVFAALGDGTRLRLVETLADGRPRSIAQLTRHTEVTRQAVSKHLRVLEQAGLVGHERVGRETHFALHPEPLQGLRDYLDAVSAHWDDKLARLRTLVEQ